MAEEEKKEEASEQKIKVGDKEYTPKDVEGILGQMGPLNEKVGKAQAILDACARYNLEPEEFLANSMGSFSLINDLMKAGIIDEEGKVLAQGKKEERVTEKDEKHLEFLKSGGGTGGSKVEDIVGRALSGVSSEVKGLAEKMEKIQSIQTGMIQADFEAKIKGKYPELSDQDVERVLRNAMSDPKKSLWQHAEAVNAERGGEKEKMLKGVAEKLKIPWDVFSKRLSGDENSLKEQTPLGGVAPLIQGKKFSLFKKEGKEWITPKQAAMEYFKRARAVDQGE